MSVVTAAKKNGEICIASDGQTSFGSTIVTGDHYKRSTKLFEIGDSVIGFVGWCSVEIVIEHLIITKPEIFMLNSRIEIFDTLLKLQKLLEEGYFVRTSDGELDQPVEYNQITGLIVNRSGLYKIVADRAVFEFK